MSIQDAIDTAGKGDAINVPSGTYDGTIDINKQITLQGAGSGDSETVLTDTADPVIVLGATYEYNPVVIISASGIAGKPVLLKDLKIEPRQDKIGAGRQVPGILLRPGSGPGYVASYSYVEMNNVRVIGTTSFGTPESGARVDGSTSLYHFVVKNCEFNNMGYGMIFHNNAANPSMVQFMEISDTTFNNNHIKGFYAEKLSDATFNNVKVINNGDTALSPSWAITTNSGIDINLKYGDYHNLTFNNLTVTGNGIGSDNGTGLAIKARGTGNDLSYNSPWATLEHVRVNGGTFSGNTTGILFGEPDKNNTSPTDIVVTGATVSENKSGNIVNNLDGESVVIQ
jgi:hypothetical protein